MRPWRQPQSITQRVKKRSLTHGHPGPPALFSGFCLLEKKRTELWLRMTSSDWSSATAHNAAPIKRERLPPSTQMFLYSLTDVSIFMFFFHFSSLPKSFAFWAPGVWFSERLGGWHRIYNGIGAGLGVRPEHMALSEGKSYVYVNKRICTALACEQLERCGFETGNHSVDITGRFLM